MDIYNMFPALAQLVEHLTVVVSKVDMGIKVSLVQIRQAGTIF